MHVTLRFDCALSWKNAFIRVSPALQTRLDTLAVAKDVGGNVGILSGVLCEVLPAWALLLIGAIQNLAGYLGLWLAVTEKIAAPPLWATSILICLGMLRTYC